MANNNVGRLGVVKPQPNEAIVGALKRLLERAESGEITGIVYYAEDGNKRFVTNAIGSIDEVQTLGAIEMLKLPIYDHIMNKWKGG